ncbi:MAG: hypothetical protein NT095_05555, partial [Burkholderiales bacterium]|nr:hypothetical protein [Burkholderiales bacterium]
MFQPIPAPDKPRLTLLLLILSGAFILGGLLLFQSPLNLQAMLWLNHLTPGLDDFWSFITQFGEGGAALLLLLVTTRFSLSGNALSLKIFLLGSLLSPLLKSWVASPRPLGVIEAGLINSIGQPPSGASSMPSGHSLTVFAAIGVVLLGAGKPIVLCAVDWTGILNEAHVAWRTAIAEAAGTTPDRVAVHCVHQHNAPFACLEAAKLVAAQTDLQHI